MYSFNFCLNEFTIFIKNINKAGSYKHRVWQVKM
jgi:hypothetical protein